MNVCLCVISNYKSHLDRNRNRNRNGNRKRQRRRLDGAAASHSIGRALCRRRHSRRHCPSGPNGWLLLLLLSIWMKPLSKLSRLRAAREQDGAATATAAAGHQRGCRGRATRRVRVRVVARGTGCSHLSRTRRRRRLLLLSTVSTLCLGALMCPIGFGAVGGSGQLQLQLQQQQQPRMPPPPQQQQQIKSPTTIDSNGQPVQVEKKSNRELEKMIVDGILSPDKGAQYDKRIRPAGNGTEAGKCAAGLVRSDLCDSRSSRRPIRR